MEIGGFDAVTLVDQLMQVERRPLTALQTRKDAAKTAADAINKIRSSLDGFRLAAAKLAETSSFDRFKATSSSGDIVTASVTGAANAGSLTFAVDRLAAAHGLRSAGTVAADTSTVMAASVITVASGTQSIGIRSLRAGAGLGVGNSTLSVTQASAGATTTGAALASSTLISGGNNTITVDVNGAARSVTIAAGTYDRAQLTSAVQSAFDASGGGVTATLDTAGALRLTTTREGSSAGLQITGGSALADLGLTVDATARTGTDGIIDVGGTTTTVTRAESGQSVAVATGAGTLDVTLAGGLRIGQVTAKTVSTGTRSLADVAAAINGANAGVSAAAVKVGDGAWRLQLSSRTTGAAGAIAIDDAVLSGLGGMVESSAAQNARLTIGSGPGAYQVESSGNTFSNVLGGVSITARSVSATPVTVDVTRNDDAVASDIAALVGAANTILADIKVQTRFDAATRTSGPLAGNSTIRRIADQIRAALGGSVDGLAGSAGLAATAGIQLTKDGSFTFDRARFMTAVADDPSALARLFGRGGGGTGGLTYASATDATAGGTYAVAVTTAATQAGSATLFAGGVVSSARIAIRVGDTTATLDVTAGQSAAQVISGLNDVFATSGLDVVAQADGAGLRLRANDWGTAGNFEINTDVLGAGSWATQAGVDVAGTINGVAAAGDGRRLTLSVLADDAAKGLAVDVPGGVTGAIGSIAYQPGLAARVVEVASALAGTDRGVLTSAKESADARVKGFTDQMTRLEDRLAIREINLRRQYSSLQTLISNMQSQGSWLSSQITSLQANNG